MTKICQTRSKNSSKASNAPLSMPKYWKKKANCGGSTKVVSAFPMCVKTFTDTKKSLLNIAMKISTRKPKFLTAWLPEWYNTNTITSKEFFLPIWFRHWRKDWSRKNCKTLWTENPIQITGWNFAIKKEGNSVVISSAIEWQYSVSQKINKNI